MFGVVVGLVVAFDTPLNANVEFGNPTPQLGCQQILLVNLDPQQIRLRMTYGTQFYAFGIPKLGNHDSQAETRKEI
ncbi:hypothetical protein AKJ16_DCAP26722 [Drosera capensis]